LGVRILLIDDDVELCGLLAELLKREGFEVQMEHDGATGLERARSGQFDLIVLDVMLPHLDGFDVLRQLRIFREFDFAGRRMFGRASSSVSPADAQPGVRGTRLSSRRSPDHVPERF